MERLNFNDRNRNFRADGDIVQIEVSLEGGNGLYEYKEITSEEIEIRVLVDINQLDIQKTALITLYSAELRLVDLVFINAEDDSELERFDDIDVGNINIRTFMVIAEEVIPNDRLSTAFHYALISGGTVNEVSGGLTSEELSAALAQYFLDNPEALTTLISNYFTDNPDALIDVVNNYFENNPQAIDVDEVNGIIADYLANNPLPNGITPEELAILISNYFTDNPDALIDVVNNYFENNPIDITEESISRVLLATSTALDTKANETVLGHLIKEIDIIGTEVATVLQTVDPNTDKTTLDSLLEDSTYLTQALANIEPGTADLSGYYTKEEVNALLRKVSFSYREIKSNS